MSDVQDNAYLDELNEAQREAVTYNDGPALVIAGAGSGKTRVLVYKLLHLIHSGYDPAGLMALTFTNKAAREMRERISQRAGAVARYINMGTFHSVFLKILRRHASLLGYTPDFSIYDTTDSRNRLKLIIRNMQLDDKLYKPNVIHNRISAAKNRLIVPEIYSSTPELLKYDAQSGVPRIAEIYRAYQQELLQSNAMDFDDLLLQTNILFKRFPEVLREQQDQIDYLLIDEYQDTNFAQYMITRQLMQEKGAIFVVGDDAQSIYSFRGANLDNILSFNKTFPTARTFKLERNYRSTQTIVAAAGGLIQHNEYQIPKSVFSKEEVGEPLQVHEALTADLEAQWVAGELQKLRDRGESLRDCAVLYRTNAQSRILEQVLRREGIPFQIYGGRSFFSHKEIMDVIAYFRLMINEQDEEALLRIINYPKRSIGDTTIQRVRLTAQANAVTMMEVVRSPQLYSLSVNKPTAKRLMDFASLLDELRRYSQTESLSDTADRIIRETGILSDLQADTSPEGKVRLENLRELLSGIDEYAQASQEEGLEVNLSTYISEIALMTDQDTGAEDGEEVTLMTIHASKGLEFDHVFIVGLEEDLFPSSMSNTGRELEEERRLFYVALTRAGKTCQLSYARERFRMGKTEFCRPSRFLRELPQELLRFDSTLGAGISPWSARAQRPARGGDLPRSFDASPVFGDRPLSRGSEVRRPSKKVYLGTYEAGSAPEAKHQSIGSLRVGQRVRHERFGDGEVMELEGEGDNAKAIVSFDSGDTKKLLLRFAALVTL